ncbi:hypothetical protein [Nocardioides sp. GY 10127]|uniref:hypothetical protein n=1 Tax=Nocardioides sp. GY 10127 TaxID=2569762 RepID=UPI0010A7F105|nr:hypothetical protein [Nocardioides sp. GY 10127]TIC79348.1 hypothetical protein E8D37_17285 [Nocardioides sp. GY 10127]
MNTLDPGHRRDVPLTSPDSPSPATPAQDAGNETVLAEGARLTRRLTRELAAAERTRPEVTAPVHLQLLAARRGLTAGSLSPEAYVARMDELLEALV